jgi:hypothetical protein
LTTNTNAHGIGNPGPGLRQAQQCCLVKPVNGIIIGYPNKQ